MGINEYLRKECGLPEDILLLGAEAEKRVKDRFEVIDEIAAVNQIRVLKAMQNNRVSEAMFSDTTGYGYDDRGRDTLDRVYAEVFRTEKALVRQQIVSGTQALSMCLFGLLRPGSKLIYATGKPYDTLETAIGLIPSPGYRKISPGSLKDFGVKYDRVDLTLEGRIDCEAVLRSAEDADYAVAVIQRSAGYEWRNALPVEEIGRACAYIKGNNPDIIILTDNCYGEFVDDKEPTHVGADIIAGSLIKNMGGGLAPTGGYIAGKAELVDLAADRLTAPGIGGHAGPTTGVGRLFYQGLFMAPHAVAESLKSAVFCASLMELSGYEVMPSSGAKRNDIIQGIKLNDEEKLIKFCKEIQANSPVDGFLVPEPWDMPGYSHRVIMAAGTFIQGATIELSADAPIKPPYIAYMQGGLVYEFAKYALMSSLYGMEREQ